jgi:hypothetical protein
VSTEKRWLDELPSDSIERELLVAGKSVRPVDGALDAGWQAFCATSSAAPTAVLGGSAARTASVKAASGVAAKMGMGALSSAATIKSFAIGLALGVGVSGTSLVVQRVSRKDASSVAATQRAPAPTQSPAPALRQPSRAYSEPRAGSVAPSARPKGAEPAARNEPRPANRATLGELEASPLPSAATTATITTMKTSLSAQAGELALVKRLLDAGATAEALRRLKANFGTATPSALAEEREALFIQALAQAQQRAEARTRARQFVELYPRSPYIEVMRRRLAEE